MSAPDTKKWQAVENRMPPVNNEAVPFYVTGEVMVENGTLQPRLKPAVPQGINPSILILELTIESVSEVGHTAIDFVPVRYDAKIALGQYSQVTIQFESTTITTIDVQIVH